MLLLAKIFFFTICCGSLPVASDITCNEQTGIVCDILCTGPQSCQNELLECDGRPCRAYCDGSMACSGATLSCPENSTCLLNCGTGGKDCEKMKIRVDGIGARLVIICDGYQACAQMNLTCPSHSSCELTCSGLENDQTCTQVIQDCKAYSACSMSCLGDFDVCRQAGITCSEISQCRTEGIETNQVQIHGPVCTENCEELSHTNDYGLDPISIRGCFSDPKTMIENCECDESCYNCGYTSNPTTNNNCITCSDSNIVVKPIGEDGTGTCSIIPDGSNGKISIGNSLIFVPAVSQIMPVSNISIEVKTIEVPIIKIASNDMILMSDVISIDISMNGNLLKNSTNLTLAPVVIAFDTPRMCERMWCYSRTTSLQEWTKNGCATTTDFNYKKTTCTCNHMSDFAVLLSKINSNLGDCADKSNHSIVELVYRIASVFYCLIALWSLIIIAAIQKITFRAKKETKLKVILLQHTLMALTSISQIARCLSYGNILSFRGDLFLTIFPNMFQFWIFTLIITQWAEIMHQDLHHGTNESEREKKFRKYLLRNVFPFFVIFNILIILITISTYSVFFFIPRNDIAITGACLFGFIYLLISILFLRYSLMISRKIHSTLRRAKQKKYSSEIACCGWLLTLPPAKRIMYFGIVVSLSFGFQSFCHVGSIITAIYSGESLYLIIWTSANHFFNISSLVFLMLVFIPPLLASKKIYDTDYSKASSKFKSSTQELKSRGR